MDELSALLTARRDKLTKLRELEINPFANDFKVVHTANEVHEKYVDATAEELKTVTDRYTVAGRLMAIRSFGNAAFAVLKDRTARIQIFVQKKQIGPDAFKIFKSMDVGDIVGTSGTPVRTKTGELTLNVDEIRLLTKNLRPLPEKWHGLTDTEIRYRQRYLDLVVNDGVTEVFRKRARIVQLIREYLSGMDFLEVETPMLHSLAGGATARPFVTHHNTLDMDLFLRIAPELYLKRLLVGGMERVFEINRNFRNEGFSIKHNPEFTMLEFYWAYATFEDLMTLTEDMISGIAKEICGDTTVTYQGQAINYAAPWDRLTPTEAIVKYSDISLDDLAERSRMETVAGKLGIENIDRMPDGKLLMEIYEEVAEGKIIQPTFVVDFPIEVSPLARKKESDPTLTDRFELIVAGREIANAFSELNDPIDQRERFEMQIEAREAGDDEAHVMDTDYIRALEYGMPPAAGEGIGIDRLVMLLTDSASIRDVILFPQLRKEQP